MKRIVVNPSVQAGIESRLLREPATYPLKHIKTRSFIITANQSSYSISDIFSASFVPRTAHVVFIPQVNVVGSRGTSPFRFSHNNVRDIYFQLGALRCPSIPFDCNYAANPQQFARVYNAIFQSSGQNADEGVQFTEANFPSNFNIFTFDFSQDDSQESFRPKQISSVNFHVQFTAQVPAALQCIIFQTSEEVLSLDSARQVVVNYPL